ncbi:3'-5' exonuclease [Acinetobacter sp. A47]|uniref:3'-5' exonuclease n=1 Tax=Acinetobacter sp. A47 TaxID=1561217 RepID=UPI000571CB52|nr:3'-5' exonuclease [Acinetobacter sp. A47]
MDMQRGLIFDTETNKLYGEIIEAAALEVVIFEGELRLLNSGHDFGRFKPSEPISLGAMATHHILDEDLEDCPRSTSFRFPAGLDTTHLIGHNIDYDVDAVKKTDYILPDKFHSICTLAMARRLWPTLETHTLSALAYHISPDKGEMREHLKEAHSAVTDCYTTFDLLKTIVEHQSIQTMEELAVFAESCRYPTHIFYGEFKGHAITDLETDDLIFLFAKTKDKFLKRSLEAELEHRQHEEMFSSDQEPLPF